MKLSKLKLLHVKMPRQDALDLSYKLGVSYDIALVYLERKEAEAREKAAARDVLAGRNINRIALAERASLRRARLRARLARIKIAHPVNS